MRPLGRHIIIDLYDCRPEAIGDREGVEEAMVGAAEDMGANVVCVEFHYFEPQGVSGTVVISESHLTIHTWPEYDFAAVDIFTCADDVDPERAIERLKAEFGPESIETNDLARGDREELEARRAKLRAREQG
jgi:S-adenosylmethionine decarboxylase